LVQTRFGQRALLFLATATFAGCGGGSTTPSQAYCPFSLPGIALLYPIPRTKDVSPNVGEMIFAATAMPRVQLAKRFYPYREKVPTKPEPVPNPLPTPIAMPGQHLTMLFAFSFKTLTPHTKYEARAWQVWNQSLCNAGSEPFPPGFAEIGSFETR
jgi:hypothetical protein